MQKVWFSDIKDKENWYFIISSAKFWVTRPIFLPWMTMENYGFTGSCGSKFWEEMSPSYSGKSFYNVCLLFKCANIWVTERFIVLNHGLHFINWWYSGMMM